MRGTLFGNGESVQRIRSVRRVLNVAGNLRNLVQVEADHQQSRQPNTRKENADSPGQVMFQQPGPHQAEAPSGTGAVSFPGGRCGANLIPYRRTSPDSTTATIIAIMPICKLVRSEIYPISVGENASPSR